MSLLLCLLVVKQARRLLARLIPEKPNAPVGLDQTLPYAQHVGYLTRKASRHLSIEASCLHQSLLIWWFLRRPDVAKGFLPFDRAP